MGRGIRLNRMNMADGMGRLGGTAGDTISAIFRLKMRLNGILPHWATHWAAR